MWEAIKNALMSVKETTGIEIPGLPADPGCPPTWAPSLTRPRPPRRRSLTQPPAPLMARPLLPMQSPAALRAWPRPLRLPSTQRHRRLLTSLVG